VDTPCLVYQGPLDRNGYGERPRFRSRGGPRRLHRWVMEQVFGPDAISGKVVMHLCDNPPCFRFDHLRIGTPRDNVEDCMDKGRRATGARHPQAKLSEHDVREIRRRASTGEDQRAIANDFDIGRNNVSMIHTKQTWKGI